MTIGDWLHYAIDAALIFAVIWLSTERPVTFAERFPQVSCAVPVSVQR